MIQNPADGSCADRAHATSSARQRRERRLRSWLRHERMTVRMELAAALHHSSFRGAGPVTYDAPRSQMTANSREDSVYFDLFDEYTEGVGLTVSLTSGRRSRCSGAPWSRLSTPCSSLRRLMFLCRRWITNWWRCAGSSMCVFPSRSSKCPRSHLPANYTVQTGRRGFVHPKAFSQFPSCHEQDSQNQDDHAAASQASISSKLVAENDPQKVPEKPHEQGFSPKSNSFSPNRRTPNPSLILPGPELEGSDRTRSPLP